MKRWLGIVLLLMPLAGCADEAGARKHLAQCELSPKAKADGGGWDDNYLSTCMQANGFVIDGNLPAEGAKCSDLTYPEIEPSCYRPDNSLAEWWARTNGPTKSN
jgi:hypothetical protein